jgi:large subunit ribosomal protein L24
MKKKFSVSWKCSKQPRKQRKYRYNAPLHIKQKFIRATLSKELRKKYGKRNFSLKKGDKVKVMTGQFKKHEGKVERINLKKSKVYVEGVEIVKKDGTKTTYPFDPSNLMITELNLDDRMRRKMLEGGKTK